MFSHGYLGVILTGATSRGLVRRRRGRHISAVTTGGRGIRLCAMDVTAVGRLCGLDVRGVSNFKARDLCCGRVNLYTLSVLQGIPMLIDAMGGTGFSGELLYLGRLNGLMTRARRLINGFIGVIGGTEVPGPLRKRTATRGGSSNCGLLSECRELALTGDVCASLGEVHCGIRKVILVTRCTATGSLFFTVSPRK